jgi:hypothetical protein
MHNWAPTVHVTSISGVIGLGTKYSTTSYRRSGGEHVSIRSTEMSYEITSWERDRRVISTMIEGKGLVQPLQTEWTLQPKANSTILSLTLKYKMTMWLFGKLMGVLFINRAIRNDMKRSLANLKHYAETGERIPKPRWLPDRLYQSPE